MYKNKAMYNEVQNLSEGWIIKLFNKRFQLSKNKFKEVFATNDFNLSWSTFTADKDLGLMFPRSNSQFVPEQDAALNNMFKFNLIFRWEIAIDKPVCKFGGLRQFI